MRKTVQEQQKIIDNLTVSIEQLKADFTQKLKDLSELQSRMEKIETKNEAPSIAKN